jgi:hypothetical protein
MKYLIFIILFCLNSYLSFGQNELVKVVIPTTKNECDYIWQNIGNIKFFESNGYSISLPNSILVDKLLSDSRNKKLNKSDFVLLCELIKDTVYKKSDYIKGYEKILKAVPLIEKAIIQLRECKFQWDFLLYSQYQISLTLYGPGGSYNSETGNILLFTTPDGTFKGYNNAENTIIHEIIHIGIESSIVNKYNLSHTLKERIVDLFVKTFFNEYLLDYRIQEFGDKRIDEYLIKKEDFLNLPEKIEQFQNGFN